MREKSTNSSGVPGGAFADARFSLSSRYREKAVHPHTAFNGLNILDLLHTLRFTLLLT